nr:hypothetical protein [uncultured Albidiferax sp.]
MSTSTLVSDWSFEPSPVPRWRQRMVLEALLRRGIRTPRSIAIKPVQPHACWALYFVYTPNGQLTGAHRFTLARLKDQGFAVLVVQASAEPGRVSDELQHYADALYWKALEGYDFSAYALGLHALARHSPQARVLVMNDSVVGPFNNLQATVRHARWDLTGFTASASMENHVQSYAFILKRLDPSVMRRLWRVFFPGLACGGRDDVILCQETRMARIASRSMAVGAQWFCTAGDATQTLPFELMEAGFPFIKKSLAASRSAFADKARVKDFIHAQLSSHNWDSA